MKKFTGFSKIGVIIGVLVVALIGVATYFVIDGNSKATNYDNYNFYSIIGPDEHNGNIGDNIKGDKNAPVLVFEYADYQCYYCAQMNPRVNAAVEKADGKLAVVYRNYLLPYHQNGTAAATAAQAAGLQGYWKEYSDKLFANQADWESASGSERTAIFTKFFEEVTDGKGDTAKFTADLSSKDIAQKIKFDMGIGKRLDVGGTPAFYVDGQFIDFSNKNGGEVTIDGKTITWESSMTGEQFTDLLVRIANIKTNTEETTTEKTTSETTKTDK